MSAIGTVRVSREDWADPDVALPEYATGEAAGADIRANLPEDIRASGRLLHPEERWLAPTALRFEIPRGYEIQVRPRSGLALKHGITLANAPGTIDSDYRGPVGVILVNLGTATFLVEHGMRIAQLVFAPVTTVRYELSVRLGDTERGSGGFGSTGTG